MTRKEECSVMGTVSLLSILVIIQWLTIKSVYPYISRTNFLDKDCPHVKVVKAPHLQKKCSGVHIPSGWYCWSLLYRKLQFHALFSAKI